MKRQLVPLVLLAWTVALAAGCDWSLPWLIAISVALVIQIAAIGRFYRNHPGMR